MGSLQVQFDGRGVLIPVFYFTLHFVRGPERDLFGLTFPPKVIFKIFNSSFTKENEKWPGCIFNVQKQCASAWPLPCCPTLLLDDIGYVLMVSINKEKICFILSLMGFSTMTLYSHQLSEFIVEHIYNYFNNFSKIPNTAKILLIYNVITYSGYGLSIFFLLSSLKFLSSSYINRGTKTSLTCGIIISILQCTTVFTFADIVHQNWKGNVVNVVTYTMSPACIGAITVISIVLIRESIEKYKRFKQKL